MRDAASDNIEKVTGWTLTRQYSFPKLAFKTTPGVDRPSTVSIKADSKDPQASQATQRPTSHVKPDTRRSTGRSGQQSAKPLVTEVAAGSVVKPSDLEKTSKSSGFKFPSKAKGSKRGTAPIRTCPPGSNSASPSLMGMSPTASSSGECETSLMTAVATTRMQEVTVRSGVSSEALEDLEGVVQPEYEVVYRGQVDLADAWEGPPAQVAPARYPKVNHIFKIPCFDKH